MRGYLGLGSNVGDRRANLQAAVDALPAHGVIVLACSSTYDTDPVAEILDQPSFLNACAADRDGVGARGRCSTPARKIERELGRDLRERRPATRRARSTSTCCSSATSRTSPSAATLPHAQATQRRFVLIPLLELDFDLRTPDGDILGLSHCLAADAPLLDEGVRREGPPLRLPASGERPEQPVDHRRRLAARGVLVVRAGYVERRLVERPDDHVGERATGWGARLRPPRPPASSIPTRPRP